MAEEEIRAIVQAEIRKELSLLKEAVLAQKYDSYDTHDFDQLVRNAAAQMVADAIGWMD